MEQLEWITRAFMQPSDTQMRLFPDFVNVADQLAVEWEIALDDINYELLSIEQSSAIKELDDYMLSISGSNNIHFWNNEALSSYIEWENMRALARNVVVSMGWSESPPPEDNAIYINHD
ncbi:hypothetical protein ABN306_20915 [Providencia huaxiensis]|uniref:Uncharacterized protein n=1 Tax=Providencia huaxiensis TaxID=2027290 RepID=A0ABU2IU47_9GAMM|nr:MULTISPECIES: hypothetical protein [Providencia]MBZ3682993.1 hypothetical protein [Providencia rettgeri]AXH62568.1 hypothetical protein CYG50_11380 [Providencia huaxiensis]MCD2527524.1 hypothetical protein [Providencia huaxiensis]MCG9537340.1 hypothetical protein [Providencia huaxiensis]MDT0132588.1 hypothetical protein [Providencia huaxiensis]